MFGVPAALLMSGFVHQPMRENLSAVGTPKEKKLLLNCTVLAPKSDGASTWVPECAPAIPLSWTHTVGAGMPLVGLPGVCPPLE